MSSSPKKKGKKDTSSDTPAAGATKGTAPKKPPKLKSKKLEKGTFPESHCAKDFECFGPLAVKDGEFSGKRLCDMGCFHQSGVDSNKFYHAAVVKSKLTGDWFAYCEWGRVGSYAVYFQFFHCEKSEDLARMEFEKMLLSKNVLRGEWTEHPVLGKVLQPKPGEKSLYTVRVLAKRDTGLPGAKAITVEPTAAAAIAPPTEEETRPCLDKETLALMADLDEGTLNYTRSSMSNGCVPTLEAIAEAREILGAAQVRLAQLGNFQPAHLHDEEIVNLTTLLHRRIPKAKVIGQHIEKWRLSLDNIAEWHRDLDAYEQALVPTRAPHSNPFAGTNIHLTWVPPTSDVGSSLAQWCAGASAIGGRHHLGPMTVKNMWSVLRGADESALRLCQQRLATRLGPAATNNKSPSMLYTPLHQSGLAPHLINPSANAHIAASNTALLFHGTRSVNVSSILRKGLMLPKQLVGVAITGAMFGPGIYFADDWRKSAGYASLRGSHWTRGDGGVSNRGGFLFVAEVVLGSPHLALKSHGYVEPPAPHDSVFAKGNAAVRNNEWIVYARDQQMLRYLVEFTV